MKRIYTFFAFSLLALSACQKEIHFPEVPTDPANATAKSTFTVVMNAKTYNLDIKSQVTDIREAATLKIEATSAAITVRLDAKALQHAAGVGDYKLVCCDNDIFERISSDQQKHWEGDGGGTPGAIQEGFVRITKRDTKGYEGIYSVTAKDGSGPNALVKEFTGRFSIVY